MILMCYFIDTNVSIGYTVPHDEWHESSVKFIENASKHIYWSNLVQKEYKEVINSIVDDTEIFLDEIERILKINEKDFPNYFEFENYILKKKQKIVS